MMRILDEYFIFWLSWKKIPLLYWSRIKGRFSIRIGPLWFDKDAVLFGRYRLNVFSMTALKKQSKTGRFSGTCPDELPPEQVDEFPVVKSL
jgi:hypothetical protein